jgi:hypothetical protein
MTYNRWAVGPSFLVALSGTVGGDVVKPRLERHVVFMLSYGLKNPASEIFKPSF